MDARQDDRLAEFRRLWALLSPDAKTQVAAILEAKAPKNQRTTS